MYCVPQLGSILRAAELSPTSALYDPSLPDLASPDVKLDCSIYNSSLKVKCETSHLCWCTVFLKAMRSFISDVSSSFAESRGGPEGSGGKSIPLASICECVYVLLVRFILQN